MPKNEFHLQVNTINTACGPRPVRFIMRGDRCFMEILRGDITRDEVEQLVEVLNVFGGIPSVSLGNLVTAKLPAVGESVDTIGGEL